MPIPKAFSKLYALRCADFTSPHFVLQLYNWPPPPPADMELDRRLLLAHCAVHALSMAAGLLVVVPMALNGSAFKGRCALFSSGYWRTEGGPQPEPGEREAGAVARLVVQQWGPPAACQFATFVGIFTVLYGAAQGWRCLFYLHGRHDELVDATHHMNKQHAFDSDTRLLYMAHFSDPDMMPVFSKYRK